MSRKQWIILALINILGIPAGWLIAEYTKPESVCKRSGGIWAYVGHYHSFYNNKIIQRDIYDCLPPKLP